MTYLIVGGGIAGLTAAHALVTRHGVAGDDIQLLEASPRIGGCLRPTTLAGQTIDAGPDALLTRRSEGLELIRSLGMQGETVTPASGRAYLATESGLRSYPPGLFLGIPVRPESVRSADVLSEEGRRRALEGFDIPPTAVTADVSVAELVTRRWGSEVGERLAGPLLAAVHAGRADYLSAAACAPQLFPDARPPLAAKGDSSSPFVSLHGGIWRLGDVMRDVLTKQGVDLVTELPVVELARRPGGWRARTPQGEIEADRVVLAVGADVAARLVAALAPGAAAGLDSVEHASVAIAVALVSAASGFPDGSGFLVPPSTGSQLLTACTWFDQKWPATARSDGRILRLSTGRHGDERFEGFDDRDLVDILLAEAAKLTGQPLELLDASVTRYRGAFPQYAVGHPDLARKIHDDVYRASAGTLALCGNAYAGVGIPAVIASAHSAVELVAAA